MRHDQIWSKIAVGKPDECWPWTGAKTDQGYGYYKSGTKNFVAHRTAYELIKGPIPAGLIILHQCDNRVCCNPNHLRPGTDAENAQERSQRNRSACKLTPDQVIEIRNRYQAGEIPREIAQDYGIAAGTARRAAIGQTWRHLPNGHPRPSMLRGERNGRAKLTPSQVAEIRTLRANGMTFAQLAKRFNVSGRTAYLVATGQTWTHLPQKGATA